MITLGIDEAGRGPLIGPMVIAGICFDSSNLFKLKELGVKDSKLLSPSKREELYSKILNLSLSYKIYKIDAKEIDEAVLSSLKITGLEAKYMAKIIEELQPEKVYIDSPMRNTQKYLELLKKHLKKDFEIICEIKADQKYLEVSAASIIAKVERDKEIKILHEKYGNFGSGYPSDPRTLAFLKECLSKNFIPQEMRKSWKSIKKFIRDSESLQKFF
jgi:ribonuclease HII